MKEEAYGKPPPKVEITDSLSIALVVASESFIGPRLASELLKLPLKVMFLAQGEADEVKHLVPNERFALIRQEDLFSPKKDELTINYIFHIHQENGEVGPANSQHEREEIQEIARNKQAKYEEIQIAGGDRNIASITSALETIEPKEDNDNLRLIKVIDPYGPRMPLTGERFLEKCFQGMKRKELEIVGEGLNPLYPLFVSDAVSALIKAMFSESAAGKTLIIGGGREITALNLAYKLREMNFRETGELVAMKFINEPDRNENEDVLLSRRDLKEKLREAQTILEWKPQTELEEGLTETLRAVNRTQPEDTESPKDTSQPNNHKRRQELNYPPDFHEGIKTTLRPLKNDKRWKVATLTMLALIIVPLLILTQTIGAGMLALAQATREVKQANFLSSQKTAQKATSRFVLARQEFLLIASIFPNKLRQTSLAQRIEEALTAGELLARAVEHLGKTGSYATQTRDVILGKSDNPLDEQIGKIATELKELFIKLSLIETIVENNAGGKPGMLVEPLQDGIETIKTTIKASKSLVLDAQKLTNLLGKLLTPGEKQTYLVLLQNSAELRPTGGFIGSYALLDFQDAKLMGFTVEDVYVADGQLKGHVEPPPPIKKYLGEGGWYLRDANWNADFPTSARQIEWFFEKETGTKVDGTIAINLYVVREFLRALGPVELVDYQATITPDNLFQIAETTSELNSFPGTTQKKDFLGSLSRSLFLRLQEADPKTLIRVTQALVTSLDQGQLLITSHDGEAQRTLRNLGWDGSLREVNCNQGEGEESCHPSFFAISEANVGVNKANYFVDRAITLAQRLQRELTQTTLTVRYQNHSQTESWPGGTYKNYLRVYFEKGGKAVSVKVDGEEVRQNIDLGVEQGKMVIGFLVDIPTQSQKTVEIVFQTGPLLMKDGMAKAVLLLQKQPGTQDDPLRVQLVSEGMAVKNSNIPLMVTDHTATLTQNFSRDMNLVVEFEKAKAK